MPYIIQEIRDDIDRSIDNLLQTMSPHMKDVNGVQTINAGVLNYVITRILSENCRNSYGEFNSAIGVLECVKQELYRRRVSKYEDKKLKQNGDVY